MRERLASSTPNEQSQSSHLIEVLKATLLQVECSTEWSQEDPEVIELKRILERRIHQELAGLPDDSVD